MSVVTVDVSEFQQPVDDSYEREWLIFRGCDGDYQDRNAARNLAWAVKARAAGRLRNFTVYVVYRPGKGQASLNLLDRLKVPHDCVLMIDAETWGSQIVGDHSTEINALAARMRVRQGGRLDLVWAYGNRGPDISVWPHKPDWLGWVVASYGGSKPTVPNMAGWQYTDGQYVLPNLPNRSKPFGACDHNVIYKLPAPTTGLTLEDIVALDPNSADYKRLVKDIADEVWQRTINLPDPAKDAKAAAVLANVHATVHTIVDTVKPVSK